MFAGETSYDKSYENQSDTVCHDNVFVYGGRMIPAPVTGRKTK